MKGSAVEIELFIQEISTKTQNQKPIEVPESLNLTESSSQSIKRKSLRGVCHVSYSNGLQHPVESVSRLGDLFHLGDEFYGLKLRLGQ